MIYLIPMTDDMYKSYFKEYENDADLLLKNQEFVSYVYSEEKVNKYINRQKDMGRIPLAIMSDNEIVGEIIIKNIEKHKSATMSITLKNAKYKDKGIGTEAEKLAVKYVFDELNIKTLYADTVKENARSQHVLEKVGFTLVREDEDFKYYKIVNPEESMFEIKEINKAHISEYGLIYAKAFSGEPWNDNWDTKDAEIHISEIMDSKHSYGLEYLEDGRVVGFILGSSMLFHWGRMFEINDLAVHPDFQGKGIAAKLLENCIEEMKNRGIKGINLITQGDGFLPEFYKKYGFKKENEVILM